MRLLHSTSIDFIGKRSLYFGLSILMTIVAIGAFVVHRGPILGIDFTGGTLVQIGFHEMPPVKDIRDTLDKAGWNGYTLQTQPENKNIIIRVKQGEKSKDDIAKDLIGSLKAAFPEKVENLPNRVEFVGPVVGRKLITDALLATFGALLAIAVYVAIRFKNWIWAFGGVLALAHDVFLVAGFVTLMGRETTLVIIACLLTLAGYSINDTIVVFDRIRENLRTSRKESLKDVMNRSINETLSRTINTSFTTVLAAMALFMLGGEVIHDFSLGLLFGVIVGTYSSVGVASSLVYVLEMHHRK